MWEDSNSWNTYADTSGGDYGGSYNTPDYGGWDGSSGSSSWGDSGSSFNAPQWTSQDSPWWPGGTSPSYGSPSTYLDYQDAQAGNPSQQMYNYYTSNTNSPIQAFQRANFDRWVGGSKSPYTANAEHALFADMMGPVSGIATPLYQAAKLAVQKVPGLEAVSKAIVPQRFQQFIPYAGNSSPASLQQLLWGLHPFWKYIGK